MALCVLLHALSLLLPSADSLHASAAHRAHDRLHAALACQALAPPADAAPPSPLDAAVLAVGQDPFRVLAALRVSASAVRFAVLSATGQTIAEKSVDFQSPDAVPAFDDPPALLKVKEAVELAEAHKLKAAAPREVEPGKRALLSVLYDPERVQVRLVTSAGATGLTTAGPDAVVRVAAYFDREARWVVAAGVVQQEQGPGSPPRGLLLFRPLPSGLSALSDQALADTWLAEGEALHVRGRFRDAAERLELSLKTVASAKGFFLAAHSLAGAGEWKRSLGMLGRLDELSTGEARVLQEAAFRIPLLREARLRGLDLNGSKELTFKPNKGFEGTSVWAKVKDRDGRTVAMFKPTNSNTYHRGEVFTYQMARLLGTEELYPVSILVTLDAKGCRKLNDALGQTQYKGAKETNRRKLMKKCAKGGLEGVVKEWVPDFVFFGAIGTTNKLKKHSIFRLLQRTGPAPDDGRMIPVQTRTHIYKPDHCKEAVYRGTMDVGQLARDLSDVMIMDVLNANEDRFPGANIEFHSLGKAAEVKPCQFDFGPSRLFSLDNGATFKGTASNGFVDFTKKLKISRFRKETWRRLTALRDFIDGKAAAPPFAAQLGIRTTDDLWRYLALDRGDDHPRRKRPYELFVANLRNLLQYLDRFAKDQFAWFK